jgi:cysteine-rich repeat protein
LAGALFVLVLGCDEPLLHDTPFVGLVRCGDGIVQPGEECDDGGHNDDGHADACRTTCRWAFCGDGVVDTGEACDDGNLTEGDGCQNDCTAHWWTAEPFGRESWAGAITTDAQGNVYATGGELISNTEAVGWVRKYDPAGNELWRFETDTPGIEGGLGVATAPDCVVVAGAWGESMNQLHAWIARLSAADGSVEWSREFAGDPAGDVTVGPSGELYVATSSDIRAILAVHDPVTGERIHSYEYPMPGGYAAAIAVAAAPDGTVALAGRQRSPVGFSSAAWVRKYDPQGRVLWTRMHDSGMANAIESVEGVVIDSAGNIVVVGFEGVPPESHMQFRIWIRKYSPFGTVLWTRTRLGTGAGWSLGWHAAIDSEDCVLATGSVSQPDRGEDIWVGKYDPKGELLWERTHDAAQHDDVGFGVTTDPDDNVLVIGEQVDSSFASQVWIRKYMP